MSPAKATILPPLSTKPNSIDPPRLMMNSVQPGSATVDAFPDLDQDTLNYDPESSHSSPPNIERRWQPRKTSLHSTPTRGGHTRKRSSMSQTMGRLRTRGVSVGKNAQEFAVALKAPISYKLIVCAIPPCVDALVMF